MPVKYWSYAGLILTYWCNGVCASCYLCCSPARAEEMTADDALAFWRGLTDAGPHGCRVHLTGGEPFGDWPRLIEVARRAHGEGLGPLAAVETNAFWAADEGIARERLAALDAAGMRKLVISVDPYHQQFVPLDRARRAAAVAAEILGPDRVQVRWRDWLADGHDTRCLTDAQRDELFAQYAAAGRDRLTGRAAQRLAPSLPCKPADEFTDDPCRQRLLRSRHVHVDPAGRIMPGTCAGIVLGTATAGPGAGARGGSVAEIWRRLDEDHAARAVLGPLAARGPVGLLARARAGGFVPAGGYASKCHLCWEIRRWFVQRGQHLDELAPPWMYAEWA